MSAVKPEEYARREGTRLIVLCPTNEKMKGIVGTLSTSPAMKRYSVTYMYTCVVSCNLFIQCLKKAQLRLQTENITGVIIVEQLIKIT